MAIKQNITIDQGSSFSTSVNVTDENGGVLDLTGYTHVGKLRKWYTSNTVAAQFTFSAPIPTNGVLFMSMTANTTANITPDRYVYDVKITDSDGFVTRIVEGVATVTPQVSS